MKFMRNWLRKTLAAVTDRASEMPTDWDDHHGWENYFVSLSSDERAFKTAITSTGSFPVEQLGSLFEDFRHHNWSTIWFPGCGFSPLPRIFASFGFETYATDIAPSAVAYQSRNTSAVQPLISGLLKGNNDHLNGRLTTRVHDFRTPFDDIVVDAILNIKALQGLPEASMRKAAQGHYNALRPGGIALFDTMNVQGERRDQLEDCLVDAGFYVPLHRLNKWYRAALNDTGIPYAFVLGSPIIPQTGQYPHKLGTPEHYRDREKLRAIAAEYHTRIDTAYQEEQESVNEETKRAQVIYSTG